MKHSMPPEVRMALFEEHTETIERSCSIQANHYIYSGSFEEDDREDLMQEMTMKVWKNLHHFDPDKGDMGQFAYTTAGYRMNELWRSRSRKPVMELFDQPDPEDEYAQEDGRLAYQPRVTPRLAQCLEHSVRHLSVPSQVLLFCLQLQERTRLAKISELGYRQWGNALKTLAGELRYLDGNLLSYTRLKLESVNAIEPDDSNYNMRQYVGIMRLIATPWFERYERLPQQEYFVSEMMRAHVRAFKSKFPKRKVFPTFKLQTDGRSDKEIHHRYCRRLLKQVVEIYDLAQRAPDDVMLPDEALLMPVTRCRESAERMKPYKRFLSYLRRTFSDNKAHAGLIGQKAMACELGVLGSVLRTGNLIMEYVYYGTLIWHAREKIDNQNYLLLVYNDLEMDKKGVPLASVTWNVH